MRQRTSIATPASIARLRAMAAQIDDPQWPLLPRGVYSHFVTPPERFSSLSPNDRRTLCLLIAHRLEDWQQ